MLMYVLAIALAVSGHLAALPVAANFLATHTQAPRPAAVQEPSASLVQATQESSPYLDPASLTPLSIKELFAGRTLPDSAQLDPSKIHTLLSTGDVIPARMVDVTIKNKGNDFLYPVGGVKKITSNADLTLINLEAPLMKSCTPRADGMTFCGRPGFAKALTAMGVDVATLENNHIGNYGPGGIKETEKLLDKNGIAWADRNTAAIKEVGGIKFGFLAYGGVSDTVNVKNMQAEIRKLRPQVDVLVVSFHWGAEYVRTPKTAPGVADQDPRKLARQAIDAGADLIQGNHPHWPQAFEIYKGKLVSYALGNLIFDQMWSLETRQGLLATYTFYDKTLLKVELTPTIIENWARPRPMDKKDAAALLATIRKASEQLAKKK